MNETLSPKQVARAIGVSESSLKRWCDRGLIPSVRTAGGHRRLMLPDVLEFIRREGHQLVEPELIGLPATCLAGKRSLTRARDELIEALVAGHSEAAQQILVDLVLADHRLADIFDHVVGETFEQVGEMWDCGTVEVYQERRACEIVTRVLNRLRQFYRDPSPRAPLAIGGTPANDPYSLATQMAELILRENGWRAVSLGTNLPFPTLRAAFRDQQPKLFWLSISAIDDNPSFLEEYNAFAEDVIQAGSAMIVGGRALTEPVRRQMRYSSFCDTMVHLEAFSTSFRAVANLSPSELTQADTEN